LKKIKMNISKKTQDPCLKKEYNKKELYYIESFKSLFLMHVFYGDFYGDFRKILNSEKEYNKEELYIIEEVMQILNSKGIKITNKHDFCNFYKSLENFSKSMFKISLKEDRLTKKIF
ncbi:unnamed protein product, partial [marine sediment metagenome]